MATWEQENKPLELNEVIAQPYLDMTISAGTVDGHPVDTIYLQLERDDGSDFVRLLLRPDEVAAIIWCLSGVLYSTTVPNHLENNDAQL